MSLISTRSRYGLLLLLDLVDRGAAGPCDLSGIAQRQGISETYLAKLAVALKAGGVLRSSRGSRGGYELARPASSIDLLGVVEVLEGRSSLVECTDETASCERSADCRALPIWAGLNRIVNDYLRGISLADAAASRTADYVI